MPRAKKTNLGSVNPSAPANPLKMVATGQPYGQAGQQQAALAAVPMTPGPAVNPVAATYDAAKQYTPPPLTPLGAPSSSPDEPVTTPIANPLMSAPKLADTLARAAAASGSVALAELAKRAAKLGQ